MAKRVKIISYDEKGAAQEADVEYGEGDTVRGLVAKTFPGAENGRLYKRANPGERVDIDVLAGAGSCLSVSDTNRNDIIEYSVRAVRKNPDIQLLVAAELLDEIVQDDEGTGTLSIQLDGEVLASYVIRKSGAKKKNE